LISSISLAVLIEAYSAICFADMLSLSMLTGVLPPAPHIRHTQ